LIEWRTADLEILENMMNVHTLRLELQFFLCSLRQYCDHARLLAASMPQLGKVQVLEFSILWGASKTGHEDNVKAFQP